MLPVALTTSPAVTSSLREAATGDCCKLLSPNGRRSVNSTKSATIHGRTIVRRVITLRPRGQARTVLVRGNKLSTRSSYALCPLARSNATPVDGWRGGERVSKGGTSPPRRFIGRGRRSTKSSFSTVPHRPFRARRHRELWSL